MDFTHKEEKSSTPDKLTLSQNCETSRKMKKHSWPWSSTFINEESPKKNRKLSLPMSSRLVGIEENRRGHRICSCNVTRTDYFRNDRKEDKEFWTNRTFHWRFSSKFPDSEDIISDGATCFYWRKKLTRSKSVTHESKDQEDSSFGSDFCNEVLGGRNNSKFQETDIVLQSMDNPKPVNLVRRISAPGILGHYVVRCNVCTHLSKSVALFVPDCGVNVHENSCKDQIAQCSKFPHTKVSAILMYFCE